MTEHEADELAILMLADMMHSMKIPTASQGCLKEALGCIGHAIEKLEGLGISCVMVLENSAFAVAGGNSKDPDLKELISRYLSHKNGTGTTNGKAH